MIENAYFVLRKTKYALDMLINPNKSLTEHWPVVEQIYQIKPEDLHQRN